MIYEDPRVHAMHLEDLEREAIERLTQLLEREGASREDARRQAIDAVADATYVAAYDRREGYRY